MQFKIWFENQDHKIEQNDDGWIIRTPYGYIDYRHVPEEDTNEIWWVESRKRGHGSELVNLMQKYHPAGTIAWGLTNSGGKALMKKYHANNPHIDYISGPHDGQFNPGGFD